MKDIFSSSAAKLKSVRYLALMAAFIAVKVILQGAFIPVGENLRISISFLFTTTEAMIIGPVAAMVSGAITDNVGFMMYPTGPFFFGYTISSMLGPLVYALFFYRRRVTVFKIVVAKAIVNYCVNVLLGSLWSAMMYSKGYLFYAARSVIKNSLMLPIEIVLIVLVFNLVIPIVQKRGFIGRETAVPLKLF